MLLSQCGLVAHCKHVVQEQQQKADVATKTQLLCNPHYSEAQQQQQHYPGLLALNSDHGCVVSLLKRLLAPGGGVYGTLPFGSAKSG